MVANSDSAREFLRIAFDPDDWIALFLKSYVTGRCTQRVGPRALFLESRVHAWLRAMNAQRFNIYVSVNAIKPGLRARTKDAIGAVRHVFVEADDDGPALLSNIANRRDLPEPSYFIHSSPNRVHVLWRSTGLTTDAIERLQKHLSSQLGTESAATPCSQTTRLPGYVNHKYAPGHFVTVEYRAAQSRYAADAFPTPPLPPLPSEVHRRVRRHSSMHIVERARRYLAKVDPAIEGRHGDLHTFKVCCRVVRGFALTEDEALAVLWDWNRRCEPPWTERQLRDKIVRARRYGSESVGALE